jgi:hypothetical protein
MKFSMEYIFLLPLVGVFIWLGINWKELPDISRYGGMGALVLFAFIFSLRRRIKQLKSSEKEKPNNSDTI